MPLLLLMLPENPAVLRTAADLLERAEEASAEYNAFIADSGGKFVLNDGNNEPVNLEPAVDPQPEKPGFIAALVEKLDDTVNDEKEIEVVRAPNYDNMNCDEAIMAFLRINGPSTRPEIAEALGYSVRHVSDTINKIGFGIRKHNRSNDLMLHSGTLGKGSHTDPARFCLNPNIFGEQQEVEEEPVIEQVEVGDQVIGYDQMTVRAAMRSFFANNNAPIHYGDLSAIIGKNVNSVAVQLSTNPEFVKMGNGKWQANPEFIKTGWVAVGR